MSSKFEWVRTVKDNGAPLFFFLGPCAIESEKHALSVAEFLATQAQKFQYKIIFKSSFDKANRTSLENYRGVSMDEGLKILDKVRNQFGLPIVTDIHESWQAEPVGAVVDVVQTPSFLCRQTDLLIAAGKTGKVVHVKKAQFIRPEKMQGAVEKVKSTGNQNVWLCERGTTFGYVDLIVDMRSLGIMKSFDCPVVFDATHSVQKPGELGGSTGGDRRYVGDLAMAAVSQRIAGVYMEVHEEPEKALSDGPNSIRLSHLPALLERLSELDAFVKARSIVEMW